MTKAAISNPKSLVSVRIQRLWLEYDEFSRYVSLSVNV